MTAHAPFCFSDSEMLVAFTVTPLFVLVPATKAHMLVVIADGFTVTVCIRDVFAETVTVVVARGPFTVSVEPCTFVTEPSAKPKFAFGVKPPLGATRVPAGGGAPAGRVPPRMESCVVHEPLTGVEIVMRVAATTPLLLRVPVAMTHVPAFRLDLGAAACSVIFAEPAETADLPDGLSDVVIVTVEPSTETTGPNTEPWTGEAASSSAASAPTT